MTLSSSEEEFVALSEAAKEVKFIMQVLLLIGIDIELPVIIHVDNVGQFSLLTMSLLANILSTSMCNITMFESLWKTDLIRLSLYEQKRTHQMS